jgi:hypothetical protein
MSRERLKLGREGGCGRTAAIELDGRLERDALADGAGLGGGILCGVQAVNVGLVVLLVVELHDLFGDVGLEGLRTC